ncbi:MAG: hypothetical protein WBL63_19605 [Candidatus Acidiferrum sp.]
MRVRTIPVLIGALLIVLCGTDRALAQCNSGSVGFVSVGLVAGNPFQAERVTTMTIEGFDAEGKRRKYERSMNASGREIPKKTNDQWCAADLQALVLQVVQDVGREVTELKNIQRVEPASSLFEIPPDYTILEKTPLPSPKTPATNP